MRRVNSIKERLICFWEENPFAVLFGAAAVVIGAAMPLLSLDFGITTDEWVQSYYGRTIIRFFLSGGADRECLDFLNLHWYGGFYDVMATLVYGGIFSTVSSFSRMDMGGDLTAPWLYETRHVINAFFGFMAVLYTGLTAKRLGTWKTGFIALIFIFISPRFLGHAMNNPKDIPFAAGYIFCFFYILRFLDEIKKLRKRVEELEKKITSSVEP
jgi:hypothetical protein